LFGAVSSNPAVRQGGPFGHNALGIRVTEQDLDRKAVDRLVAAKSAADAWLCIRDIIHEFGFDHTLYGTNRLRGVGIFGKKNDSFFLSDFPQDVMSLFWEEELYRTAPIAIWAMQNEGPMSLRFGSDLFHAGKLPADQHETQAKMMELGVTSGYVIGFNPPDTTVATALALINTGKSQEETDEIWDKYGDVISTYASIFNLRMASLPIPKAKVGLTERQREVLHWVAHGKTSAEIATILGLSSATIEKHLRQARETLGVSTTTQAVLYAQINSHIFTTRRD